MKNFTLNRIKSNKKLASRIAANKLVPTIKLKDLVPGREYDIYDPKHYPKHNGSIYYGEFCFHEDHTYSVFRVMKKNIFDIPIGTIYRFMLSNREVLLFTETLEV